MIHIALGSKMIKNLNSTLSETKMKDFIMKRSKFGIQEEKLVVLNFGMIILIQ